MGIEPTEPPSPTAPLDLKSRGGTSPLALPGSVNYISVLAFSRSVALGDHAVVFFFEVLDLSFLFFEAL